MVCGDLHRRKNWRLSVCDVGCHQRVPVQLARNRGGVQNRRGRQCNRRSSSQNHQEIRSVPIMVRVGRRLNLFAIFFSLMLTHCSRCLCRAFALLAITFVALAFLSSFLGDSGLSIVLLHLWKPRFGFDKVNVSLFCSSIFGAISGTFFRKLVSLGTSAHKFRSIYT